MSTGVSVHVDPTSVTVQPTTVDIVGLNDIKLTIPQPLQTESSLDIKPLSTTSSIDVKPLNTASTINTDSNAALALDVKPLTVDMCLNISVGKLPETCIRLPFHQHFGFTLFGIEILGFNMGGESQIIIQDLPNRPQVAWGGEQAVSHQSAKDTSVRRESGGGLHIRLDK